MSDFGDPTPYLLNGWGGGGRCSVIVLERESCSGLCSCPPSELADVCREQLWMQMRGVAAARGVQWKPRSMAAARLLVAELTRDTVLLERLAGECLKYAR